VSLLRATYLLAQADDRRLARELDLGPAMFSSRWAMLRRPRGDCSARASSWEQANAPKLAKVPTRGPLTYLAARSHRGTAVVGAFGVINAIVVIAFANQAGKAEQPKQADPAVIVMFVARATIISSGGLARRGGIGRSSRRSLAERGQR
jgi:hypothetical protein